MTFGSPSKRNSYWVYKIQGGGDFDGATWLNSDQHQAIELGAGSAVVPFPGSLDRDGEWLTFDKDGAPQDFSEDQYAYDKNLFEDDLSFLAACIHELLVVSELFKRWNSTDRATRDRSIDLLRECGWHDKKIAELIDTAAKHAGLH
jgi:hypothetical protein